MGDCVFTIFGVCVFTKVETYETIIVSISLVAKRHQHLLMSMDPTKEAKQGYHSTVFKYEYAIE